MRDEFLARERARSANDAGWRQRLRASNAKESHVAEVALAAGCAGRKHDLARDSLSEAAPFSKILVGSGDTVCWCVKRALLSQGYMLDRPDEGGSVLTGTRDFQPQAKLSIAIHLQATCADNRNGTSIVFAISPDRQSQAQSGDREER